MSTRIVLDALLVGVLALTVALVAMSLVQP